MCLLLREMEENKCVRNKDGTKGLVGLEGPGLKCSCKNSTGVSNLFLNTYFILFKTKHISVTSDAKYGFNTARCSPGRHEKYFYPLLSCPITPTLPNSCKKNLALHWWKTHNNKNKLGMYIKGSNGYILTKFSNSKVHREVSVFITWGYSSRRSTESSLPR